MANFALKIAWLYRLKTDEESEKRYLLQLETFIVNPLHPIRRVEKESSFYMLN